MFALLIKESVFFFKILVSFLVQLELLLLKPFSKQLNNFKERIYVERYGLLIYESCLQFIPGYISSVIGGGRGGGTTHVRSPVPGTGEIKLLAEVEYLSV